MSNDLNQCNFIGRLGRDPDVRHTADGNTACNFSLAVGEQWRDKATGEKKENTLWVRCVAWRQLAEICGQHLTKGARVFVSGKLTERKWTDKSGADRVTTELIVDRMQMLGGGSADAPERPAQATAPKQTNQQAARHPIADMDDDIPF